jgi:hypothetical protein
MAKKQAQFRFDESLFVDLGKIANDQGITISEIVRNAIKSYVAIYERTREAGSKLYIENRKERCELVLPWLL